MKTSTRKEVPIGQIEATSDNPRKTFLDDDMAELTQSVKQSGILQPLLVRSLGKGKGFRIIAGERRYRAALANKLKAVPVVVVDADERTALELAIVENEQRADVPLHEKAAGYQRLIDEHGATLDDLARRIGKSKSTVRGILKLLNLPEKSREALADGAMTPSVASLIAAVPTEPLRLQAEERYFDDRYGGRPTYESLKGWIQSHQCRQLKGAPFNPNCTKLVPEAGSCKKCPKRAGNMEDVTPGTRADICTDVECYKLKVHAHGRKEVDAAVKKGHTPLSESEIKTAFPYGSVMAFNCPWYAWGDGCYWVNNKEGATYEALFAKFIRPEDLHVGQRPDGEPVYLIGKERAMELAEKHYKKDMKHQKNTPSWNGSKVSKETDETWQKKEAERKRAVAVALAGFTDKKREETIPYHTPAVLRFLAVEIIDYCSALEVDELWDFFGMQEPEVETRDQALVDFVEEASPSQVCEFLAAYMAIRVSRDPTGRPDDLSTLFTETAKGGQS